MFKEERKAVNTLRQRGVLGKFEALTESLNERVEAARQARRTRNQLPTNEQGVASQGRLAGWRGNKSLQ
jgi:hypothetical protein